MFRFFYFIAESFTDKTLQCFEMPKRSISHRSSSDQIADSTRRVSSFVVIELFASESILTDEEVTKKKLVS